MSARRKAKVAENSNEIGACFAVFMTLLALVIVKWHPFH